VRALAGALAEAGPPAVRQGPRVGLVVPTPAGQVVLTVASAHARDPHELAALLAGAADRARAGSVDAGLLAPADATVAVLDAVERAAVPARPGTVLAVGLGAAAERVVALGGGMAVRPVVTVTGSADPGALGEHDLALLLARTCAALAVPRAGA
jgi:pyruvate/2-oxoglutarate dehydrogenase complex dihydrolipoamide acyltransferase (E2) component